MTPDEIIKYRERLNVSQSLLADALGIADGSRVIRAWEFGSRGGKPYAPSGSALAALRYVQAITEAINHLVAGDEIQALRILRKSLPEEMR